MILINNLFGPYNAEKSEGRGANAAYNVIKYIEEGKRISEEKTKRFMNNEISLEEAVKNPALEQLSKAYVPYIEISEETGLADYDYGLAFTTIYMSAFDSDKDGIVTPQEAGPFGAVLDIKGDGKITAGIFLAWLILHDCMQEYNGIISPKEAGAALMLIKRDPEYVQKQIKSLYYGHKLDEKEKSFISPLSK